MKKKECANGDEQTGNMHMSCPNPGMSDCLNQGYKSMKYQEKLFEIE